MLGTVLRIQWYAKTYPVPPPVKLTLEDTRVKPVVQPVLTLQPAFSLSNTGLTFQSTAT